MSIEYKETNWQTHNTVSILLQNLQSPFSELKSLCTSMYRTLKKALQNFTVSPMPYVAHGHLKRYIIHKNKYLGVLEYLLGIQWITCQHAHK